MASLFSASSTSAVRQNVAKVRRRSASVTETVHLPPARDSRQVDTTTPPARDSRRSTMNEPPPARGSRGSTSTSSSSRSSSGNRSSSSSDARSKRTTRSRRRANYGSNVRSKRARDNSPSSDDKQHSERPLDTRSLLLVNFSEAAHSSHELCHPRSPGEISDNDMFCKPEVVPTVRISSKQKLFIEEQRLAASLSDDIKRHLDALVPQPEVAHLFQPPQLAPQYLRKELPQSLQKQDRMYEKAQDLVLKATLPIFRAVNAYKLPSEVEHDLRLSLNLSLQASHRIDQARKSALADKFSSGVFEPDLQFVTGSNFGDKAKEVAKERQVIAALKQKKPAFKRPYRPANSAGQSTSKSFERQPNRSFFRRSDKFRFRAQKSSSNKQPKSTRVD